MSGALPITDSGFMDAVESAEWVGLALRGGHVVQGKVRLSPPSMVRVWVEHDGLVSAVKWPDVVAVTFPPGHFG